MKKLVYVLCALCVLVVATGCSNENTPKGIEKAIYTQFQKGNYKKGFDIIFEHAADQPADANTEQVKEMSKALAEKVKKANDEKGGISKFEITKETIAEDGKSAEVTTLLTYGNGTTDEESSKYIKGEDGKWARVVFGK